MACIPASFPLIEPRRASGSCFAFDPCGLCTLSCAMELPVPGSAYCRKMAASPQTSPRVSSGSGCQPQQTQPVRISHPFDALLRVFVNDHLAFASRHVSRHCGQIQRICVVTNNFRAGLRRFHSIWADLRVARLVKTLEHDAGAAYHAFLQQIVGFRAGRPKLFTSFKSASQQVMETDAGEAYGVFQDVDSFAGVKTRIFSRASNPGATSRLL